MKLLLNSVKYIVKSEVLIKLLLNSEASTCIAGYSAKLSI